MDNFGHGGTTACDGDTFKFLSADTCDFVGTCAEYFPDCTGAASRFPAFHSPQHLPHRLFLKSTAICKSLVNSA